MDLQTQCLMLTCHLYSNLNLSKTDVQFVMALFINFIKEFYNPSLLLALCTSLDNVVSEEVLNEIKKVFEKNKTPFDDFDTEDKRINFYKKIRLYVDPEKVPIGSVDKSVLVGTKLTLKTKEATMVHIPLAYSLTQLLQVEGLFDATIEYLKSLSDMGTAVIENFTQGSLWKELLAQFIKEEKEGILLPLFLFFDDIQTGNSLGSHASSSEVGGVYATIPCLPPNFSSKLQSIIMSDIFLSEDRKNFKNFAVFKRCIDDLNHLRKKGIEILVHNKKIKVYFATALIIGDNLGLNSILGYVSSFTNSVCCRICYASGEKMQSMLSEDTNLLRTELEYEKDVQSKSSSVSGIVEKCIFHALYAYNCIKHACFDIMHDWFEGVCLYAMCEILLNLIESGLVTLCSINYNLRHMNFGYEASNVPPSINLDYLKNNRKLKMSASECIFFVRYFGVIVSDCDIPANNLTWKLYCLLRDISDIITSPEFTQSQILQLDIFITQFNDLYILLFGVLKPKFHMILHYVRLLNKVGPLSKCSGMRFESFHTILKNILSNTKSHQNILITIASRYLLSIMNLKFFKYEHVNITKGGKVLNSDVDFYFPNAEDKYEITSVKINHKTYAKDAIIIVNVEDDVPIFGRVLKVFVINDKIILQYKTLISIGYNTHY